MVGRIKTGSSFEGVMAYNMNKAELLHTNMLGDNFASLVGQMNLVAKLNDRIEKPVKHFVVSFAPGDENRLTDELCKEIAESYLKQMGYSENQFCAFLHKDTDNSHIHIVCNRVRFDGTVVKDNNERYKSREALLSLEKKYSLSKTQEAGESKFTPFSREKKQFEQRISTEDEKQSYVRGQVQNALKKHPISLESLERLLANKNIAVRISDNKKGLIFSSGEYEVKGSKLSRSYSFENIQAVFKKNAFYQFNAALQSALKTKPKDIEGLFAVLKSQGFLPLMNKARNGWSMEKEGVVIKGSDIHRMGFKNLQETIQANYAKNEKSLVGNALFAYFKGNGSTLQGLADTLKKSDIEMSSINGKFQFKHGQATFNESEIGGRVGQFGISYLLNLNQVDNILVSLVKNGIQRDNLKEELRREGVEFSSDNGLYYKINGISVKGTDLYKNNDKSLLDNLEKNRIKSVVLEGLKTQSSYLDFVAVLSKENIEVKTFADKSNLAYKSGEVTIDKGKFCDIAFVEKQLSQSKSAKMAPLQNQTSVHGLGNPSTRSKDDDDEESRRRKFNRDFGLG